MLTLLNIMNLNNLKDGSDKIMHFLKLFGKNYILFVTLKNNFQNRK